MPQCAVPWGDGEFVLPLPDHWTLAQVATPTLPAAPSDWADRMAVSLTRPEGSPPLADLLGEVRDGGRIVIVLEDMTRHSPLQQILPVVVRELEHAGIPDDHVEILFATGMHPSMTPEDAAEKIGHWCERFAWRCNEARDEANHIYVGEVADPGRTGRVPIYVDRLCAEADLRIIVNSVSPHLQAGFGGGAKMLAPGCASIDTLSQLHLRGLPKRPTALVGMDGAVNPMRGMIDALGDLVDEHHGKTFAIQYVLDENDLPASIAVGDMRLGQQMLAKQCAASAGVVVDAPADILITNAYPRDYDLWQSFKCIPNTAAAVRPNGVILALARCPAGMNMEESPWPVSPKWTRRLIRWIGVKGIVSMGRRLMPGVSPEAHFFIQLAVEAIYRNEILMYAPEIVKRGQKFPGLPFYGDITEALESVDQRLGPGSRRVAVFTMGGTSYPVL